MSEILQGFLDKIDNHSSKKEPDVPVHLPLGVLPEFTQHRTQIHLTLDIEKRGLMKKGDVYKTSVKASDT